MGDIKESFTIDDPPTCGEFAKVFTIIFSVLMVIIWVTMFFAGVN